MFCREILSLIFTAMLVLQVPAQLKALKIGDPIPEEIWSTPLQTVNSPHNTMKLGEARDKLILLDFWATWCAACLKNFPKMNALEKQFEGKVKIVPVTKEDPTVLAKFFASKNGQRYKGIESVAGDRMFSELFPYVAIPFMVWIKNGKVISTTDADQVTEVNISKLLEGKTSSLQTVVQIDRTRPLMLAEQFDLEKNTNLMNYVLFSKGRIRASAPGSGFHRQGSVTYGRQFTNVPLNRIYRGIAYPLFEAQGQRFSKKRLVNETRDPSLLDFTPTDGDAARDSKSYSIEFIVPTAKAQTLYPEMLKAVNTYSGYTGTLEILNTKCLVLKEGGKKPLKKAGKESVTAMQSLQSLITDLNDSTVTEMPVINESGYEESVAIDTASIKDMVSLKKAFVNAGFEPVETERNLLMLIIRDRESNVQNTIKH